jgi:CRISPR-associated protein Cmr3
MSFWLIEPRDPLIARDGRPAVTGPFRTLAFPFPSTIAGAVRTRLASGTGTFNLKTQAELAELLRIEVGGPLLAELDAEGEDVLDWLAPAPRDAQLVIDPDQKIAEPALLRLRLRPRVLAGGTVDSLSDQGLLPVAAQAAVAGKPPLHLPAFWRWEEFAAWLLAPPDRSSIDVRALGFPRLPVERRSHLAIQPKERVGIDGMLFETAGLRFLQPQATQTKEEERRLRLAPHRLALALRCGQPLLEQLAPLGGERRLARWRRSPRDWPALPAAVRDRIVADRRARLLLLTPACFTGGALPGWNGQPISHSGNLKVTVRAACVSRPEIVSGWDLAKGQAKPTRRLAPAGSVYFVEIAGGSREDVERWCDATWLAAVSDGEQDRRDGFGLAALGTWENEENS